MKFKIIVKKWAVFYFFVQNLSEWHFSCMKEYNIVWRRELEPFTEQQEEALRQFNRTHQKYSFGKNYLGRYFYLDDQPIDALYKTVPLEDFEIISKTFSVLENKFDDFYKHEYPLLTNWQSLLEEHLNNNENQNESIIKNLKTVYHNKNLQSEINVFILPSIENITSGSGNIGDTKSITTAISHQPFENYNRVIAVLWHEAIHRFFEKEHFFPMIQDVFPQDQDAVNLVKEATASSLFPNGLLGRKFLGITTNSLNKKLPEIYNEQILALTKHYMEQNQAFDKQYINEIYSITSDLKGVLR